MEEYTVNNRKVCVNIFEEIRDNDDAYLIGYLAADGAYHQPTHKRKARFAVSSTDKYIISFFNSKYQPSTELRIREPNNNDKRGITGRKTYINMIFSSLFSKTFEKFGILSLKKDRDVRNIPPTYFNTFLLGLFDADGSISYGYRKDRNRLWGNFRITHASSKVLSKVEEYLKSLGITSSLKKKGKESCYVLTVSKLDSVKYLFNVIYNNKPSVFNYEKFKHFSELLNMPYIQNKT